MKGLFILVEIQTLFQINRQRLQNTWHERDKYAQKGFSNDKIIDKETKDLILNDYFYTHSFINALTYT